MKGKKFDQNKPDYSLIPKEALDAMAYAFMYGAKKYGTCNYRYGMEWRRPAAAALRHTVEFISGAETDAESGAPVLGHAMAALAMAEFYRSTGVGIDDRPNTLVQSPLDSTEETQLSLSEDLNTNAPMRITKGDK